MPVSLPPPSDRQRTESQVKPRNSVFERYTHPNPGKAADGKRLHRLQADPITAPVVQRIYREYLAGAGIYAIAERLTRDGILSLSAADPARNSHRHIQAWGKSAIRVILTNPPRYTGRRVWNKQRKAEILIDVDDVALGHETKMRWNPTQEWVYSTTQAHEALIDDETFEQAQTMIAAGARRPDVDRKPPTSIASSSPARRSAPARPSSTGTEPHSTPVPTRSWSSNGSPRSKPRRPPPRPTCDGLPAAAP